MKVAPLSDKKTISFNDTSSTQKDTSSKTLVPVQTTIPVSVTNKQTTEAEIMWDLEVLDCKYSYRSCGTKCDLFCAMFPDSKTAVYLWKNKVQLPVMSWYLSLCQRGFIGRAERSAILYNLV